MHWVCWERNKKLYYIYGTVITNYAHDERARVCLCHGKSRHFVCFVHGKLPFDIECRARTKRRIMWHVVRRLTSPRCRRRWLTTHPTNRHVHHTRKTVHLALSTEYILIFCFSLWEKHKNSYVLLHIRIIIIINLVWRQRQQWWCSAYGWKMLCIVAVRHTLAHLQHRRAFQHFHTYSFWHPI